MIFMNTEAGHGHGRPFHSAAEMSPLHVEHYTRVYALSHAFFPEPLTCAAVANAILSDAISGVNKTGTYRRVVLAIRARKDLVQPVPACSLMANFAWLLKDVAALSYADIGEVLQMEADEVRQQIAEVREAVLACLEETPA
jgi:hypothetical protein